MRQPPETQAIVTLDLMRVCRAAGHQDGLDLMTDIMEAYELYVYFLDDDGNRITTMDEFMASFDAEAERLHGSEGDQQSDQDEQQAADPYGHLVENTRKHQNSAGAFAKPGYSRPHSRPIDPATVPKGAIARETGYVVAKRHA